MKDDVKKLLGIEDDKQDDVLEVIIEHIESQIKSMIDKDDVPDSLEFVVTEVAVRRFNRLGTEGMKSESVEGHSVTYYDAEDDFGPYMIYIDNERDDDDYKPGRGKVMFI